MVRSQQLCRHVLYQTGRIDGFICHNSRLIRIFGSVLDTPARQNANKFAFALGLFVSLHINFIYHYDERGY